MVRSWKLLRWSFSQLMKNIWLSLNATSFWIRPINLPVELLL